MAKQRFKIDEREKCDPKDACREKPPLQLMERAGCPEKGENGESWLVARSFGES
jgi:hypothetical protein